MVYKGRYFLQNSAKDFIATIYTDERSIRLETHLGSKVLSKDNCKVSRIIIGQPIVIEHEGRLEFPYNRDLADFLFENKFVSKGIAFDIENSIKKILLSLSLVCVILFLFFKFLLPMSTEWIALRLPQSALAKVDSLVLEQLDSHFLKESKLDIGRQKEIEDLFKKYYPSKYKVHFRDGGALRANALALVDGNIILTDQLVELLRKDEYILSVLLHEVGHLHHKDSANKLISDSFLSLVSLVFIGDLSGTAAILVNLTIASQVSKYSRSKEKRADIFASNILDEHKIPITCFTESLNLLAAYYYNEKKSNFSDLLSSHPKVKTRVNDLLRSRPKPAPCL